MYLYNMKKRRKYLYLHSLVYLLRGTYNTYYIRLTEEMFYLAVKKIREDYLLEIKDNIFLKQNKSRIFNEACAWT